MMLLGFRSGSFPKLCVPFWGPYKKDYSILGSILGSPFLGNYQVRIQGLGFRVRVRCFELWVQTNALKLRG